MSYNKFNIRGYKYTKRKNGNKILPYPTWRYTPEGEKPFSQRRKSILEKIKTNPNQRVYVNREGCWKTNTNEQVAKDLRRMIKLGDIKLVREYYGSWSSRNLQISFITIR